jgi:hypothetical protein
MMSTGTSKSVPPSHRKYEGTALAWAPDTHIRFTKNYTLQPSSLRNFRVESYLITNS